jgi:hypothetical protein
LASLRGRVQTRQTLAYDPIPPPTAVRSVYDDFLESVQGRNPLVNASFLTGLLTSILPWNNAEGLPEAAANVPRLDRQQVDEAMLAAENALPGLFPGASETEGRDWLAALRGALQGLMPYADEDHDSVEENEEQDETEN